jgi:Flp pilus assembly protein TadG
MSRLKSNRRSRRPNARPLVQRQGVITVVSAVTMVACFAFISFGVDTGLIVLTRNQMQNAVDAAALAASQELVLAVSEAGENGSVSTSTTAASMASARTVAATVAQANGVFIDAQADVKFGRRAYNPANKTWPITWGNSPYNVVKVTARRENSDLTASDGQLRLAFGWAVNKKSVSMRTSATSFVQARDMVLVMDFSGSMNDDSTFNGITKLGKAAVEANQAAIFTAMGSPNVGTLPLTPDWPKFKGAAPANSTQPQLNVTWQDTQVYVDSTKNLENVVLQFTNGNKQTFSGLTAKTGTFKGTGSNSGKQIAKAWVKSGSNLSGEGTNYGERFEDTATNIKKAYGLNAITYPYPSGSWDAWITYCQTDSQVSTAGYKEKYGKLNLVNYILVNQPAYNQTPVMWKTPHYPFHAIKQGATLFTEFLTDLAFDDRLGLVSYDDSSRVEQVLSTTDASVDISSEPLTAQFSKIDTIQRHKQASHYSAYTAIGYGLRDARTLLDGHAREGASRTIVLMTDGLANRKPAGWSLPSSFHWSSFTDYDGDGHADYTSSDSNVQYAFYEASQAIADGATIHTISVGVDGDDALLQAIAYAGGGIFVDIPGGSTVSAMEAQLLAAFAKIGSKLPPPKLVYDP